MRVLTEVGCLQVHPSYLSFRSEEINRRCGNLIQWLEEAINDEAHNRAPDILESVSEVIYMIDDYYLRLDNDTSLTDDEWHTFTHLMLKASRLWHLILPGN
jgi:hypothetical protein